MTDEPTERQRQKQKRLQRMRAHIQQEATAQVLERLAEYRAPDRTPTELSPFSEWMA